MVAVAAGHGADEGALVHVPGDLRQQLADADAGDARWDGAVGPANIDRSAWLGIERLEMARAAAEKDEDARRLAVAGAARPALARLGFADAPPVGEGEPEEADAADLENLPTGDPLAIARFSVADLEHD